jgi:hypothetical protein
LQCPLRALRSRDEGWSGDFDPVRQVLAFAFGF